MSKLIIIPIIILSMSCNWSDIKELNGKYVYPKECHIKVGKIIKENEAYKTSNNHLLKSIELKDLALEKADKRISLWRDETYEQHQRLLKQEKLSKWNDWLYFSGGILFMALGVMGAGQLK